MGPGTYKDQMKGFELGRDKTGSYSRGLCKTNTEQCLFINDAKIRAANSPVPTQYKPNYVSFIFLQFSQLTDTSLKENIDSKFE